MTILTKIAIITLCIAITPVHCLSTADQQQLQQPKYIILITLDTVRSDHTTYMGYPRETTPFLNELAQQGVLFTKMRTPIPFTLPSHEAIFTSIEPQNQPPEYVYPVVRPKKIDKEKDKQTLSNILQESQYTTSAFVSMTFMTKFNNHYDHFYNLTRDDLAQKTPNTSQPQTIYPGKTALLVTKALEWQKKNSDKKRQFIWLHLYDTHYPYDKTFAYTKGQKDPDDIFMQKYWIEKQGAHLEIFNDPKEQNMITTLNNYDGALQNIDSQIRKFYTTITSQIPKDQILWIIIPDHGEGLTSHLYYGHHKRLYEEQLLTPAIFIYQGKFKPHIDSCDALNTDILPTIAEIIGQPLEKGHIQGQSLIKRLSDMPQPCKHEKRTAMTPPKLTLAQRPAGSNTPQGPVAIPSKYIPIVPLTENEQPSIAIYEKSYKYIYSPHSSPQLYDIDKDPNETNNLTPIDKTLATRLGRQAEEFYNANASYWQIATPDTQQTQQEKQHLQQLKSLGY